MVEVYSKTILEVYKGISKYHLLILKFNLYIVRYEIISIHTVDLTECLECERYKKIYRLIYGL